MVPAPAENKQRQKTKKIRTTPKKIYICCYHKVGSTLLTHIFEEICKKFDWKFAKIFGLAKQIPGDANVILFAHSLLDPHLFSNDFTGVHIIRDPRDVIVSGYLYHSRCSELWCTNTEESYEKPILFPQVPYSQEHKSHAWKIRYIQSLGGKSYQENIKNMSPSEGVAFEMANYGAWTIENMLEWNYDNSRFMETRFESMMGDFDNTFKEIFLHLGFSESHLTEALKIASAHDINRMTASQLKSTSHISSRDTKKWPKYFDENLKNAFKNKFGDALVQLGYESNNSW